MTETVSLRDIASVVRSETSCAIVWELFWRLPPLPVPLGSLFYPLHRLIVGAPPEGCSPRTGYLVDGSVSFTAIALQYLVLSPAHRADVFRLRQPSQRELVAATGAFVVGFGVF